MGFVLEIQSPSPLTESTQSLQSSNKTEKQEDPGEGKEAGAVHICRQAICQKINGQKQTLATRSRENLKGKTHHFPDETAGGWVEASFFFFKYMSHFPKMHEVSSLQ